MELSFLTVANSSCLNSLVALNILSDICTCQFTEAFEITIYTFAQTDYEDGKRWVLQLYNDHLGRNVILIYKSLPDVRLCRIKDILVTVPVLSQKLNPWGKEPVSIFAFWFAHQSEQLPHAISSPYTLLCHRRQFH